MPSAIKRSGASRHCAARDAPARSLPQRKELIARGDLPQRRPWRTVLLLAGFSECFSSLFNVIESELSGFDQMGHQRRGAAAKEAQQIVDESPLCRAPGYDRFIDMRVADLLGPANRALGFQPREHGLHRRMRRPVLFWKSL